LSCFRSLINSGYADTGMLSGDVLSSLLLGHDLSWVLAIVLCVFMIDWYVDD